MGLTPGGLDAREKQPTSSVEDGLVTDARAAVDGEVAGGVWGGVAVRGEGSGEGVSLSSLSRSRGMARRRWVMPRDCLTVGGGGGTSSGEGSGNANFATGRGEGGQGHVLKESVGALWSEGDGCEGEEEG